MTPTPRSSRRRYSRAIFSVSEEVSKRPFSRCTDALDDRGSGAGPPVSAAQGVTDLAEAIASIVRERPFPPA